MYFWRIEKLKQENMIQQAEAKQIEKDFNDLLEKDLSQSKEIEKAQIRPE